MSQAVLHVEGLSGGYGPLDVLRNVHLAIHPGEIVALLGANGAGKSTLLNAIVGFLPRMTGVVEFDGRSIAGLPSERMVKLGLGLVPERRQLFGAMTVEENLMLGAYSAPSDLRRRVEAQYARFPILGERRRQLAQTLSGGQQQMLAIARALIASPRVLLLDEPSLGLAPIIVAQVFAEIRAIREAGGTVLVVEQNAAAALRIADRAYILKNGRIVDDRSAAAFLADDTIAETYLGGGAGSETMEVRLRAKARRAGGQSTQENADDLSHQCLVRRRVRPRAGSRTACPHGPRPRSRAVPDRAWRGCGAVGPVPASLRAAAPGCGQGQRPAMPVSRPALRPGWRVHAQPAGVRAAG